MPELDLGNVKGPQGKSAYQSALDAGYSGSEEAFNTAMAKAPDAVLYTAQSLTDGQKAQARTNINAAPGGFGLGSAARMLTEADNVDSIRESGWYTWDWDPSKQPAGLPEEAKYHTGNMRVDGTTGGGYTTQTIYFAKNGSSVNAGDECVIQRLRTTAPWEWVNPPMILGTEYRTTERYLGKPVYVKVVDCGSAPSNSLKKIDTGLDYTVIDRRLTPTGNMYANSNDNFSIPCESTNVAGENLNITHGTYRGSENVRQDAIFIYTTSTTLTGYTVYAVLKYTKTTD